MIGGYALEFYWRVGLKYELDLSADKEAWYYEPHVGEAVFREMLDEAHVDVLFDHRLREQNGVKKKGTQLVALTTEDGSMYRASIYADCSYEGDLMAQAGVTYTWGRESSQQYRETLAGVRERTPFHQFVLPISAYDSHHQLLSEISPAPRGTPGSADKKVQAYNFRLILSHDPANRIPFPQPPDYNPNRYELLARYLNAEANQLGRSPRLNVVALIGPIPNHKADFNNQGPFSTDYIGKSWDYPNTSYARRAEIWQDHVNYTKGFFYFLAHDPHVPKPLQQDLNRWGLAKDEFQDTDHWPHHLYIREARRMVGDFVMTQKDEQTDLTKPDAIGIGSYENDSHNVQRYVTTQGTVQNEGDMQIPVRPYQIPYRVMLPKRTEAANLLVPVCVSASHVAHSSLRVEPQYMIMGQAAGVAAWLAIRNRVPVQDVDTQALAQALLAKRAVLEFRSSASHTSFFSHLWDRYVASESQAR